MLRAALILPVLLLAACGAPNSPSARFEAPRFEMPSLAPARPGDPRTNAAVAQTCREQSARELQRQDRGQLLREDESQSRLGAGFAARPSASESDRLGRQFLFERRINECIRANTQATPEPVATPAAAPAPPPAAPRRGARPAS